MNDKYIIAIEELVKSLQTLGASKYTIKDIKKAIKASGANEEFIAIVVNILYDEGFGHMVEDIEKAFEEIQEDNE